jgi:hypothetical protein
MSLQWSLWSVRSRFGAFVSAGKISFPGNGDFGSKRRGSTVCLLFASLSLP